MVSLTVFALLPLWYQLVVVGFLGAVLASFANVVAYRMHTNVSLGGRSRCFSCGHQLRWFELVPILSYTALRGRCRACRARIPARDVVVELAMAGLFVVVYLSFTGITVLLSWLLLVLLLIVALYDLEHFIIPDELVLALGALGLVVAGVTAWPWVSDDFISLLISVVVAAGVYFGLWQYSYGRWLGFGDVKLAAALGLFLTVEQAFSMVVLSFWVGAVVGLGLVYIPKLLLQLGVAHAPRAALTMKSEIPFAPFIVVAFLVVYMYDASVLSLFSFSR
jgi:leader peptidase (prepilin peptidase)/N-methyltransferase